MPAFFPRGKMWVPVATCTCKHLVWPHMTFARLKKQMGKDIFLLICMSLIIRHIKFKRSGPLPTKEWLQFAWSRRSWNIVRGKFRSPNYKSPKCHEKTQQWLAISKQKYQGIPHDTGLWNPNRLIYFSKWHCLGWTDHHLIPGKIISCFETRFFNQRKYDVWLCIFLTYGYQRYQSNQRS